MIIQKVRFRNVLGFGNYWSEIQLDKNDLTIITGENGAGKSSMLLDTITFALYGRLFRDINKNQYINSITKKELVVELFFSIGRDEYQIVRGIKPDIFDIFLNDVLIPQNSDKRGYQDYLETNIIKCGFKTFSQIVILGSTDYVPFLKLKTPERRIVVENVLDLELISVMNALLKKDAAVLAETIRNEETRKTIITEKIKIMTDNTLNAQKRIDEQIDYFNKSVIKKTNEIISFKQELDIICIDDIDYSDMIKKIIDYNNKHDKIASSCLKNIRELEKEIKFYEHTETCQVCGQEIDLEFKENRLNILREKLQSNQLGFEKSNKKLIEGRIKLEEFQTFENERKISFNKKTKIETAMNLTLASIENDSKKIEELKNMKIVTDEQSLIDVNTDLGELNRNLNVLYGERNIQQIILKILKDDGGKAEAVKGYIKDINDLINKFLIDMDFFVQFYLDENFNEVIKSRYRDEFSYNSFSDGQKLRINLAILFAWRELAKRRNSVSINLLVFDEVLSGSLDAKGVADLIDILKKFHQNENIFLITHGDGGMSRVDETLKVSMVQGFSRISEG